MTTAKSTGTAYALWCLCIFGICGVQRFYVGKAGSGILYLITFGFFGIGQLIDLALIPELVRGADRFAVGNATASSNVNITLGNLADLMSKAPKGLETERVVAPAQSNVQKILSAAKENGGRLSLAQAVQATGLEAEETKALLAQAERSELCHTTNDEATGRVRYDFDV